MSVDWIEFERKVLAGEPIDPEILEASHQENIRDTELGSAYARFFIEVIRSPLYEGLLSDGLMSRMGRLIELNARLARMHGKRLESQVCAVFDYLMSSKSELLPSVLLNDITGVSSEVVLPCGVADRVISHGDGSITVAEVKQQGSRRDHACGVGQSLVYAAALRQKSGVTDVRPALVVGGNPDQYIASACESAGVIYVNIYKGVIDSFADYAQAAASCLPR